MFYEVIGIALAELGQPVCIILETFDKALDLDPEKQTHPGTPRLRVHRIYWPLPWLAASACCILFAISAFTASRLKLAPRCIGG
jgi:hypothetical protein